MEPVPGDNWITLHTAVGEEWRDCVAEANVRYARGDFEPKAIFKFVKQEMNVLDRPEWFTLKELIDLNGEDTPFTEVSSEEEVHVDPSVAQPTTAPVAGNIENAAAENAEAATIYVNLMLDKKQPYELRACVLSGPYAILAPSTNTQKTEVNEACKLIDRLTFLYFYSDKIKLDEKVHSILGLTTKCFSCKVSFLTPGFFTHFLSDEHFNKINYNINIEAYNEWENVVVSCILPDVADREEFNVVVTEDIHEADTEHTSDDKQISSSHVERYFARSLVEKEIPDYVLFTPYAIHCMEEAQKVLAVDMKTAVSRLRLSYAQCDKKQLNRRTQHILPCTIRCYMCKGKKKELSNCDAIVAHFLGAKHQNLVNIREKDTFRKAAIAFWIKETEQCARRNGEIYDTRNVTSSEGMLLSWIQLLQLQEDADESAAVSIAIQDEHNAVISDEIEEEDQQDDANKDRSLSTVTASEILHPDASYYEAHVSPEELIEGTVQSIEVVHEEAEDNLLIEDSAVAQAPEPIILSSNGFDPLSLIRPTEAPLDEALVCNIRDSLWQLTKNFGNCKKELLRSRTDHLFHSVTDTIRCDLCNCDLQSNAFDMLVHFNSRTHQEKMKIDLASRHFNMAAISFWIETLAKCSEVPAKNAENRGTLTKQGRKRAARAQIVEDGTASAEHHDVSGALLAVANEDDRLRAAEAPSHKASHIADRQQPGLVRQFYDSPRYRYCPSASNSLFWSFINVFYLPVILNVLESFIPNFFYLNVLVGAHMGYKAARDKHYYEMLKWQVEKLAMAVDDTLQDLAGVYLRYTGELELSQRLIVYPKWNEKATFEMRQRSARKNNNPDPTYK